MAVGFAVTIAFVVTLTLLQDYETWAAMLVGPILFGLSLPIFARQARREGDRRLFWFLVIALAAKLGGAFLRYHVVFDVYDGVADASGYHGWGRRISENFRAGDFTTGLESLTDTNFMRFATGLLYSVIGPTALGGFLFFSWLGFWGLFFFYRAFVVAVPGGRARTYGKLIFFLPSLLFWPSSIGKEAWMIFTLGMACYGAAGILSGRARRGAPWLLLGLWLAALVRVHMAGLVGVALAAAYLLRRPRGELRELRPIAKGVSIIIIGVFAAILVVAVEADLRTRGIDTRSGLASTIEQVGERTEKGGSEFVPTILRSPQRAPIALVTVLFRPFPMEANNFQALAASLESLFLIGYFLYRFRWGVEALRRVRESPYVAFALVYAGLFTIAFSGIANFGLLVRQRVQLLPLLVLLFCIPPTKQTPASETAERPEAASTVDLPRSA